MIRFPEGIDAARFLRDYWQREPLLIRQGLPGFTDPLSAEELAGLALEEEVESRLVETEGWRLRWGPFAEEDFLSPPNGPWSLLVQGVDLWLPEVQALLDHFDFLPRWRLEDVMVSYAVPGGGVGPHFDAYDVFLIQGSGRRRWQIGQPCDTHSPLRRDTAMKILQAFEPEADYVLEPGDVLYLPPGVAHCGTAVDECLTYSVGFRAPSAAEMLDDLATELLSRNDDNYYRDPPLTPAMAGDTIDPAFIQQVRDLLSRVLDDEQLLAEWFAAYMTAPKNPAQAQGPSRRAILPGKPSRLFEDGGEMSD